MRRNGLSPNRIGTVGDAIRRNPPGAGGLKSVFGAFWGLGQKALRRGTRVLSCGRLLRRIRAHTFVCLTESAAAAWGKQKSPGWPLPSASYRSAIFMGHSVRGLFAEAGRPFVCAQMAAKSAVIPPMFSRQAKLPVGNFDAAAQAEQ